MAESTFPAPNVALPAGIRRALVIGLGVSGITAVRALRSSGVAVVAVDDDPNAAGVSDARAAGATTSTAPAIDHLDGIDLVVPSPGISEHAPVLRAAAERGIDVWSEPELGWRLWPHQVVAITGTNGKTSVTELTAAMLERAGIDAVACGNIGRAFTEAAATTPASSVLVAELSSFQLRFATSLAPDVAIVLNLAPDHLDWHGGAEAYGAAKARVWEHQETRQHLLANLDDAGAADLARAHAGDRGIVWFSADQVPDGGIGFAGDRLVAHLPDRPEEDVVTAGDLALDAPHHRSNVAAAAAAALLIGADAAAVGAAAADFRPGHHRMELVAEGRGVRYVDDSKATNAHAAAAALASYPSIVWVAGGLAKGVDLSVLAADLGSVRAAVLIGSAAVDLQRLCEANGIEARTAPDIETAVAMAADVARSGDTVLLAPACASFDQFSGYAERGDRFAAAARAAVDAGA